MATEFNDAIHKGFFMAGDTLRNGNGFSLRQSELTLAALRSAGLLDNMVDGLVPPSTDKLWLDKNFDPSILKEWNPIGAAWEQVTNQTLFGRLPFRGDWDDEPIYRRGDLVGYSGSIWIATLPSQNHTPANDAYWDVFLDGSSYALGGTTITAGTGLTGGGSLASNRTIGLSAGSVASLALADTSVQPNADAGINRNSTAASQAIPPGAYGGNFLANAFASSVFKYIKNAVDATIGPRFLFSFSSQVTGGHANGPDAQRGILWLLSEKLNWLTTTQTGEIDAMTIQVRQGQKDDAGGILIDGAKAFLGAGDTGGLTPIELAGARVNGAGTVLSKVRAVLGFQEGAGGATNGNGAAGYFESETGGNNFGVAIVNNTSAFLHAIAGFTSRSPAARWFSLRWDGEPVLELGTPSDAMKIRYSSSTFKIQDETGSLNHYVLGKDGIARARVGVQVANNQAVLARVLTSVDTTINVASTAAFTSSASFTVSVPGAVVGDMAKIDIINGTLAGAQFNYSNAAVTSSGVVTCYPFNMSGSTADPAVQTVRATVLGFS